MKYSFAIALLASQAIKAEDQKSTDFANWKNSLNEDQLQNIYNSYVYEAPRRLAEDQKADDAHKSDDNHVETDSMKDSMDVHHEMKSVPSDQLVNTAKPYGDSNIFRISSDRTKQSFLAYNSSPAKDIPINELNSIKLKEGGDDGSILLTLNRNDRLLIDADDEDEVKVTFMGMNGATLDAEIHNTGLIQLEYTTEFGKHFKYSSNAANFAIPNLIIDSETGELVPDSTGTANSFALYSSIPSEGITVLEIPALNLKLNFKFVDETICLTKKAEKMKDMEHKEEIHTGPTWDYSQSGADWGKLYRTCNSDQQSPINLVDAISSYGQAYDIMDKAVDVLTTTYGVMKNVALQTDNDNYKVQMLLNRNQEYNGFISKAGEMGFHAPRQWVISHAEFKYESEHTINEKRMDLEMQIYHDYEDPSIVHEEELAAAVAGAGGAHRRLAGNAAGAASTPGASSKKSDATFETSAISIFFDTSEYVELTDEEKAKIDMFFDSIDHNGVNQNLELGQLLEVADWDNRWIYKGSKTQPPCDHYVYWNVLKHVYPISPEHLEKFKSKILNMNAGNSMNYRQIQKGINKDVAYISSGAKSLIASTLALTASLYLY